MFRGLVSLLAVSIAYQAQCLTLCLTVPCAVSSHHDSRESPEGTSSKTGSVTSCHPDSSPAPSAPAPDADPMHHQESHRRSDASGSVGEPDGEPSEQDSCGAHSEWSIQSLRGRALHAKASTRKPIAEAMLSTVSEAVVSDALLFATNQRLWAHAFPDRPDRAFLRVTVLLI